MKKFFASLLLLFTFAFAVFSFKAQAAETVSSLAGKRVLWLGDSITQNGLYVSYVEYFLNKNYPSQSFDIVSLGLASETVSGLSEKRHPFPRPNLFERLNRALDSTHPEVVVACYGMNDGIYHPQDPERMKAFQAGIQKLISSVKGRHAKLILLTPPPFDPIPVGTTQKVDAPDFAYTSPYENYDSVLSDYTAWERTLSSPEVTVIDLHTPLSDYLKTQRANKPDFKFAGDGIHPDARGQLLMAQTIVKSLGAAISTSDLEADVQRINADPLWNLVKTHRGTRASGWLPFVGYTRGNTVKTDSVAEAEAKVSTIQAQIDQMRRAVKVACIGDSITAGVGVSDSRFDPYPVVLGRMLGSGYVVRNFGASGRTLLKKGNDPYWRDRTLQNALDFKPDIVVIQLGTNDSKHPTPEQPTAVDNWQYKDEFAEDAKALVSSFQKANPSTKIYLCQPVPAFPGQWGINNDTIHNEIGPILRQVATETGVNTLDLYTPLAAHGSLFPDTVHPNTKGAQLIAAAVYRGITGRVAPDAALLKISSFFSNGAVLQRDAPLAIFGTARQGENITVEFAGQTAKTIAKNGVWKVVLQPIPAGGPFTLVAKGDTEVQVQNVLMGDVWIASGQSNMERQLKPQPPQQPIVNWEQEVANANYPQIRQFNVRRRVALEPISEIEGEWAICSPQTVPNFSAVGYFFARDLFQALKVPIGIVYSAWGGTPAHAWMSQPALQKLPDYQKPLAELRDLATRLPDPATTYNAQLAWYAKNDAGSGPANWADPALDTAEWKTMPSPANWDAAGLGRFDGVAWFRKEIQLPASFAGKTAVLHLGTVDDWDSTWVNGVLVGSTQGNNVSRDYKLASNVLKPGRNVVVVRVLDRAGSGGFGSNADLLRIDVPAEPTLPPVSLAGPWLYKTSVALPDAPLLPLPPNLNDASRVSVLFNGMIAPLQQLGIKGTIWYQGESDSGRAGLYRELFPLLISDWRSGWGRGDFPFLFVQVAPYGGTSPEIRESQFLTLKRVPNTAMVVTTDIGDAKDIHPPQKEPVGARLSLAARSLAYNENIEYSGPLFESVKFEGGKATMRFSHSGSGLWSKDAPLKGFVICGADKKFVSASAQIIGDTVVASSAAVPNPVAVRYGWANVPDVNLFNREGLPASPFRSDVD